MSISLKEATVRFIGQKPILFDKYPGSNESKLQPREKVYWDHEGRAVIPQINLYSALCAENSKSVAKMFFGKRAKPIAMAIQNSLGITEMEIPLTKNGETILLEDFDKHFEVVHHVARINKSGTAVPNPKERPMLSDPWELEFSVRFVPSGDLTWDVMCQCFQYAGVIGIGTYRPLYGGFDVEIED